MIELESVLGVVSCVQKRHAEWPQATELRIALLKIAQALGQQFNGNVFVISD